MSTRRAVRLAVLLALLAAWAWAPAEAARRKERSRPMSRLELIAAVQTRGLDASQIILPYDVTDEMRAWAKETVPKRGTSEERLSILLQGLLETKELGITYHRGFTATAPEVFQSREANCLAFTHLFVGLARELGIRAYFLEVEEVQGFEKEGDLVIVSGHVTAGYGPPQDRRILEFSLGPEVDYRRVQVLSDLTAIALYYSNRGAEVLRSGDVETALQWLEVALTLDPDLPAALVNKGVAVRRQGDEKGAEGLYRRALEVDPEFVSAYQNLAALLRYQNRTDEAMELLELTDELGTRNPYSYLNLGDLSLARGRLDEAKRFYRKALNLYRDHADPYAALGLWELASGNRSEAKKWLKKAREAENSHSERVKLLEARLSGKEPPAPDFARIVTSKHKES